MELTITKQRCLVCLCQSLFCVLNLWNLWQVVIDKLDLDFSAWPDLKHYNNLFLVSNCIGDFFCVLGCSSIGFFKWSMGNQMVCLFGLLDLSNMERCFKFFLVLFP